MLDQDQIAEKRKEIIEELTQISGQTSGPKNLPRFQQLETNWKELAEHPDEALVH